MRLGKKKGTMAERRLRPNPSTTILDQNQVIDSASRSKRGENVGILQLADGISSKTPFILR